MNLYSQGLALAELAGRGDLGEEANKVSYNDQII